MMDIGEIRRLLPHRYPFLLVDRVVEVVKNASCVGIKNVTINENYFQGHFPQHPVMPGVLIIESMAQTAAVLVVETLGPSAQGKLVYFMTVDNAKFRKPVLPGDRLQLGIEVVRHKGVIWKTKGTATVDGVKVAEGEFLATVVDKDAKSSEEPAA